MDKKRGRLANRAAVLTESQNGSEPSGEMAKQQAVEKGFLQMSGGKREIEAYKVPMMLKSNTP